MREADYDRPATLVPAFAGSSKVLLIPSAIYGRRFPQMQSAVDAAVGVGVAHIFYASFINAPTSTLALGDEHRSAEDYITKFRTAHTFLRNGAYTELYCGELGDLAPSIEAGELLGSGGDGAISGATRGDLAAAAAAILTLDQPADAYELAGPAFTLGDVAAEMARLSGRPVRYRDLSSADYAHALQGRGVPAAFADLLADTNHAITRGDWHSTSRDLETLIARAPTPMAAVLADHYRQLASSR